MKKILSLILTALLAFGVVGCSNKDNSAERYPKSFEGEYTLYDYEDYASNIEILHLSENFGILTQNDDKQFVKSGSSSLKITPQGSKLSTKKPYFILPMTSDRFHFSYQDFTKMYSVKCSIYNGATEEIPVSVGMTLSPDYKELSSYFENYSLKTGWNEIEYVIWNGAQLKGVSGIYFRFDNYAASGKTAPQLYMDDFKLVQKSYINRLVENQPVEEGELCKIHDFSSLEYFSIAGYGSTYQAEWVSDSDLELIEGDYTGKAVKFTMPIYIFGLLLQPRISRNIFLDYIAEGYTKLTFYVAAEVENNKNMYLFAEAPTAYQGPMIKLPKLTWQKITIDITDENMYTIYKNEGVRLIGLYMDPPDWYDDSGNRTTMHIYVGDITLEK